MKRSKKQDNEDRRQQIIELLHRVADEDLGVIYQFVLVMAQSEPAK